METIRGLLCACGAEAEGRCDWPVKRWTSTDIALLREGDLCSNQSRSRTGRVLLVEEHPTFSDVLRVTIQRVYGFNRNPRGVPTRVDRYLWIKTDTVQVFLDTVCRAPACYQHIRNLGGDKFICSEHWQDQLEAITRSANAQTFQAATTRRFERQQQQALLRRAALQGERLNSWV